LIWREFAARLTAKNRRTIQFPGPPRFRQSTLFAIVAKSRLTL